MADERELVALARAIKQRREALGLTQEDVAHASGMSVRHYQKIEGAVTNPRYLSLVQIAHALKTSLSGLVDSHGRRVGKDKT